MNLVIKYKVEILLLFTLVVLYFILRLPNLTLQPIFADEAIYIRWAQVMRAEPTLRFLPQASEGKQPLFMWLMIPLLQKISDPLLAGRFLSVLAGFATLVGILLLTCYLFRSKWVSFIAGLIYTTSPFMIFFNRLALVDSQLAMFGVWTIFFGILTARLLRFDLAMLTGFSLGGALLTKSPAIFFEMVLPFTWILSKWPKNSKAKLIHLMKLTLFLAISLIIANAMYNILRLGPAFDQIAIQNKKYVFEISHIWINPKDPFIYHLRDMWEWFWYLGPAALIILIILGVLIGIKNYPQQTLSILLWALIPLFAINMYAKVFTARYILYTIPALLILASLVFLNHKAILRKAAYLFLGIFLLHALYIDFLILTDPFKMPLPRNERSGYFEEWTAGYGLKQIAQFLEEKSKKEMVVVGTEGTFGTLPDGLQIYLDKNRNVVIIGGSGYLSDQIRNAAKEHPTFFVANRSRVRHGIEGVELLKEYPKTPSPDGKLSDAILLFQVLPN